MRWGLNGRACSSRAHLGAEPLPNGAHLKADHARPNHNELLGDLIQLESARAVHDDLPIVVHLIDRPCRVLCGSDLARTTHCAAALAPQS
eukprot:scaffold23059_cov31-Tisochrysis_lutea.AAC.2